MILVLDQDVRIELPTGGYEGNHICDSAPSAGLMRNPYYRREVIRNTYTYKRAFKRIGGAFSVWDGMCGIGAGSAMAWKYLKPKEMMCSDIDPESIRISRSHLPDTVTIIEANANNVVGDFDVIVLDFNTFTLNRTEWLPLLKKAWGMTEWLLLTDSACFGFRRNARNLASYGVESPHEYYRRLADTIGGLCRVGFVLDHGNSAVVALNRRPDNPDDFRIQRVSPSGPEMRVFGCLRRRGFE